MHPEGGLRLCRVQPDHYPARAVPDDPARYDQPEEPLSRCDRCARQADGPAEPRAAGQDRRCLWRQLLELADRRGRAVAFEGGQVPELGSEDGLVQVSLRCDGPALDTGLEQPVLQRVLAENDRPRLGPADRNIEDPAELAVAPATAQAGWHQHPARSLALGL